MPLLTRLALLILAGAGVLAALGCGGAGGDKTFEGEGYSFTYPGDWVELEPEIRTGGFPDVLVGPETGWNGVALQIVPGVVREPYTEANFDQMVRELRPSVESLMRRAGTVLEGGPTQVSYVGLHGIRFEGSFSTELDPVVRFQQLWLLDGTTMYSFNCQFLPAEAEKVGQACDLVLSSFQLSD